MPQDAFTLQHIAKELNQKFTGGKISKINQPERDELSLLIYTRGGTVKLEISASAKNNRISLSSEEKPNPKTAPNFCMLLRKHLQNAEVLGVSQVGFERIIRFDLKCFSEFAVEEMSLFCEIMGKYSNVILVQNGIILGAMKQTSLEENAKRILFSGAKYTLPAPQDKADPRDISALQAVFEEKSGDAAKFISGRVAGIAYSTALDMTEIYGENIAAEQVYSYVNSTQICPCVTFSDGEPNDFKARFSGDNKKVFPDVLSAQEYYYSYVYRKTRFADCKRRLSSALSSALKKLEKRLGQIESKLAECCSAEEIKLKGELITANIYLIQRGMTHFEAVNYYDENGGKIAIELDRQLSPSQNAQKYYKKYAKLKRTEANLTVQRREAMSESDYLKSIECHICAAETLSDLEGTEDELISLGLLKKVEERKKQKSDPSPFREYSIDGFTVLSGRNNAQNDRLLKALSDGDIWLHTQKYHSAHVGIITEGKRVPDETVIKAAQICAYYSDAKERDKTPVDYTLRKFVKKPPKSNSGFVTYTEQKTVLVAPDAHRELKNE